MEKLTAAFNVVFYWCGVWAVMVFGTSFAHSAFVTLRRRAFRRDMRRRADKLMKEAGDFFHGPSPPDKPAAFMGPYPAMLP